MNGKYIEFVGKGKAVVEEYDVPQPDANAVLIENDYTVISAGTERANLMQMPNTGTTDGKTWKPGYSGAGRVIAAGSEVTNLKVGDRVVVNWGCHASHTIKPAESILKIEDDSIDLLDASFAPIVSFPQHGVRALDIKLGESAMIAGMGILGAFAVQLASLSGAVPVVVADFDPERRKLACELGASAAFSPDEENFIEKVKEATYGGPNAVVEVTGASVALQQALEYIAWKGRISLLGCTRVSDTPIDYYKYVHRRGITLVGTHTATRCPANPYLDKSVNMSKIEHEDYRVFLKLVAAKKIQTGPIISEIVSPDDGAEVYARLAENKNPPLGIVFDWSKIR